MPETADVAFYTLISGPRLSLFGTRPNDGVRREIDSMSFRYVRSGGDQFVKGDCQDAKVVFAGESMHPSRFESKILGRKVGRWETAVRIQSDDDEPCTFSKWFSAKYLGKTARSMKRASGKPPTDPHREDDVGTPGKSCRSLHPEPSEREEEDGSEEDTDADTTARGDDDEVPESKRRKVVVRTRGLPRKFADYLTGDIGLVRDESGRVVAVRAALPSVSFPTLRQFFAHHTDESALLGLVTNDRPENDPPGDRVVRVGSDPLGRGVIFSFLEDVGRDDARRRYYMYDPSRAEFVKFCGFDGGGSYVGFGKTRACYSPDALKDTTALQAYLQSAERYETAFNTTWRAVVEDHAGAVEESSPAGAVDPDAIMNEFPFEKNQFSCAVADFIFAAVREGGEVRKRLTLRYVVRSLRRPVTKDERFLVMEMMRWLLLKLKVV